VLFFINLCPLIGRLSDYLPNVVSFRARTTWIIRIVAYYLLFA
jgi:hypothetical protein